MDVVLPEFNVPQFMNCVHSCTGYCGVITTSHCRSCSSRRLWLCTWCKQTTTNVNLHQCLLNKKVENTVIVNGQGSGNVTTFKDRK